MWRAELLGLKMFYKLFTFFQYKTWNREIHEWHGSCFTDHGIIDRRNPLFDHFFDVARRASWSILVRQTLPNFLTYQQESFTDYRNGCKSYYSGPKIRKQSLYMKWWRIFGHRRFRWYFDYVVNPTNDSLEDKFSWRTVHFCLIHDDPYSDSFCYEKTRIQIIGITISDCLWNWILSSLFDSHCIVVYPVIKL